MIDRDLVAGAVASRLRLQPEVQQLYPARPSLAHPIRTAAALLGELTDEPAVTVSGRDPLLVEVDLGLAGGASAVETGRALIAEVAAALPDGPARIRLRIATID